ncbi:MAG: hypothetical protein Q9O24_08280 [Gammaproteobacteria bacterium]|nr:hypothetical protein [Gammaproteobacteria bacterium]
MEQDNPPKISTLEKYKIYHKIDKWGFWFFWLSTFIIIFSYPAHYAIQSYNQNLFFFDRFGALALALLLFSEFRINGKILSSKAIILDMKNETIKKIINFHGKKSDLSIHSALDSSLYTINILHDMGDEKIQKSKEKVNQSNAELAEYLTNLPKNIEEELKPLLELELKKKFISFNIETIQSHILSSIIIATIIWGFGSLLY